MLKKERNAMSKQTRRAFLFYYYAESVSGNIFFMAPWIDHAATQ